MLRLRLELKTAAIFPISCLRIRCLERAQAAESEREDAVVRLRAAAEETAELKGKLKFTDSLRVIGRAMPYRASFRTCSRSKVFMGTSLWSVSSRTSQEKLVVTPTSSLATVGLASRFLFLLALARVLMFHLDKLATTYRV